MTNSGDGLRECEGGEAIAPSKRVATNSLYRPTMVDVGFAPREVDGFEPIAQAERIPANMSQRLREYEGSKPIAHDAREPTVRDGRYSCSYLKTSRSVPRIAWFLLLVRMRLCEGEGEIFFGIGRGLWSEVLGNAEKKVTSGRIHKCKTHTQCNMLQAQLFSNTKPMNLTNRTLYITLKSRSNSNLCSYRIGIIVGA